ncbi:hypothetical protein P7K49_007846, partial [Saguinus oedipus]
VPHHLWSPALGSPGRAAGPSESGTAPEPAPLRSGAKLRLRARAPGQPDPGDAAGVGRSCPPGGAVHGK